MKDLDRVFQLLYCHTSMQHSGLQKRQNPTSTVKLNNFLNSTAFFLHHLFLIENSLNTSLSANCRVYSFAQAFITDRKVYIIVTSDDKLWKQKLKKKKKKKKVMETIVMLGAKYMTDCLCSKIYIPEHPVGKLAVFQSF